MFLRNLFFLLLGIILVAALSNCRKLHRVAYYRSLHPDPSGWTTDNPMIFTADSNTAPGLEPGRYNLYMILRYRDSFSFGKLFLRLEATSLMNGVKSREICINMEHPASNPGATVKYNKSLVELTIPLGYNYVDQGWSLTIEQRMTPPPITGINDVGIKMVSDK